MVLVVTHHGLTWLNRRTRTLVGGSLELVKVGNGTATPDATTTDLSGPLYATAEPSEVTYYEIDGGATTVFEFAARPGQNVPAGSKITEMGAFVNGTAPDGTAVDFGDLQSQTDPNGNLLFAIGTRAAVGLGDGLTAGQGDDFDLAVPFTGV